jgi:hypothetical protein
MQYEAKFIATPEDAVVGYRMFNRWPDDFLKLCAIGSIVAIVIFGVAACILHTWVLAIGGMWTGAGVFGIPWLMEWRIRHAAKKSRPEEVKVYFTDEGIEVSNDITQNKHSWREIKKVMLDERGVLFSIDLEDHSGAFSFFIPVHAFVDGYFPLKELKLLTKQKTAPRFLAARF